LKTLISLTSLTLVILFNFLTPAVSPLFASDSAIAHPALCSESLPERSSRCAQLEANILSSTVRVYFQTWVVTDDEAGYEMYESVGHATVKDGSYLVTHNHTEIPLSIRQRSGDPDVYTKIFLTNAAGDLLHEGPLTDFSIIVADTETLVFAHKEAGFLTSLGFTSATFRSWETVPLSAGMEVAQIDWDGERASVKWVPIEEITVNRGVPQIKLASGVMAGASGGGIFWQGEHIANNWRVKITLDGMDNVIDQTTTAALNSQGVAKDQT
jgi:hypothetical protein